MEGKPLVSIITLTYNHERFIGQCIESVLAQTYPYWEQIIIDDGSTDKTGDVVARYKDKRVKYVRQDNAGVWNLGKTYNRALQISRGELIAILEGDDFWPPYKLEMQVPIFDRNEVVLTWGRIGIVDTEGKLIDVNCRNLKWFRNKSREEVIKRLFLENIIPASSAICRKDALLHIGGFKQPDHYPFVDYPTWLELSLVGELEPVDEILGYWRRHQGQLSTNLPLELGPPNSYSIELFKRLPKDVQDSIRLDIKQLLVNEQRYKSLTCLYLGRIRLIEGKWQKAREEFRRALDNSSPYIKGQALLGLMSSYCRMNMEWIAKIVGKPRFG